MKNPKQSHSKSHTAGSSSTLDSALRSIVVDVMRSDVVRDELASIVRDELQHFTAGIRDQIEQSKESVIGVVSDVHVDDDSDFLNEPEVLLKIKLSRATLSRMIRRGEFPAPIRLSANRVAWKRDAIEQWQKDRVERTPKPDANKTKRVVEVVERAQ